MAINIPIITEFSDAGLKSAQGAFNNFKTKVGEANGAMGKLKAGSTVAFDTIRANAGKMAFGAGVAIGGFAMKAIGDFKNLALSVDDFRNKTNLTLLESSKWVSYTGDLGIQADSMSKIFTRLSKAATDQIPAFKELGVAIALGEDGRTDIEETFLRVNDAINSLDDPVKQAAYRADLFGRGWQDAAELVQMGSADIRKALDGVKDFEVIDEEEVQKAKDLRRAQDELGDAVARLSVQLGEALLPAFTALLDAARPLLEMLGKIDGEAVKQAGSRGSLSLLGEMLDKITPDFLTAGSAVSQLNDVLLEVDEIVSNQLSVDELQAAWEEGARAMIDATTASDDLADALISVDDALAELKGEVDERQAWRNLQDEFDNIVEAAVNAFTEGTPEAIRASEKALDDARLKVGQYVAELDTIDEDKRTEIIASLNTADIMAIDKILNDLARAREIRFLPTVAPGRGGVSELGSGGYELGAAPMTFGLSSARTGVTVNVQGSVISENDLVETVRKGLVDGQRSGSPLLYSNS